MPPHLATNKTTVLRMIHIPKCGGTSLAWSFDAERSRYFSGEWGPIATACRSQSSFAFGHVIMQAWHHWTYSQWLEWDRCVCLVRKNSLGPSPLCA